MNRLPAPRLLLLLALLAAPALHAQTADDGPGDSPLDGVDRVGGYAGANAGLQWIDERALPLPPNGGASVNTPIGISAAYGILYSRSMPNLFITKPPADPDPGDTLRLYRRITTLQVRLLYSRIYGVAGTSGLYPLAGSDREVAVRQTVRSSVEVVALEPALLFDLAPMGSPARPMMSLGASLGHITSAAVTSELTPTGAGADTMALKPDLTGKFTATRRFYAALLLGGGARIDLGGFAGRASVIVPQLEIVIPLTSIAAEARWIPIGIRFGVGFHYPL